MILELIQIYETEWSLQNFQISSLRSGAYISARTAVAVSRLPLYELDGILGILARAQIANSFVYNNMQVFLYLQ